MTDHNSSNPAGRTGTRTTIELDLVVAVRIYGHLVDLLSTDDAPLILDDLHLATDDLIALHAALAG